MSRRGVTLIELLIALAITMIMMGAVVTLFANMTTSVTDSRAVIEMSERLRAARNLLQSDLGGHTSATMPPLDPSKDLGFVELIEGLTHFDRGIATYNGTNLVLTPYVTTAAAPPPYASGNSIMGDSDDIIHMTVRSTGKPFVGRVNGTMMESQTAEVIWFALPNGRTLTTAPPPISDGTPIQLYTLYRRVLLVLPGYNLQGVGAVPAIYANYDISAHNDLVTGNTVANTLGDLTKRENRYYHGATPGNNPPANFPFPLNINPAFLVGTILTGNRLGEDVVLDNVLAFDVRVFDPLAPTYRNPLTGLIENPGDIGYVNYGSPTKVASQGATFGCFVDIGYQEASPAGFSWNMQSYFGNAQNGQMYSKLLFTPTLYPCAIYDTWSTHYEQNGYDEDGVGGIDQGMNGLDDPSAALAINGVVDDPPSTVVGVAGVISISTSPGERETLAPFPYPLRAMQVTLRVYEPDSRQVRQVTVVQDFVPE